MDEEIQKVITFDEMRNNIIEDARRRGFSQVITADNENSPHIAPKFQAFLARINAVIIIPSGPLSEEKAKRALSKIYVEFF